MPKEIRNNNSKYDADLYIDDNIINSDKNEDSYEEGECNDNLSDDNLMFDDGYDEDLMGDDNDRDRLNTMTEVDREKELFKRMERREALKARIIIENRLKAARNNNNTSNGKNRPKRIIQKNGSDSINIIRNKRMKRKMDMTEFVNKSPDIIVIDEKNYDKININESSLWDKNEYRKRSRKQKYLRGNFEEDSDEEFQDTYQKKSLTPVSTLDEFNKLRISRHKLALWIHQPFFEDKIPGFFVRFSSNNILANVSDSSGSQPYQAFEVTGILKSNRPYKFGDFFTNKVLQVQRGQDERVVRMEYVSNQIFTEEEFQAYVCAVTKCDKPLPTLEMIEKKQHDIDYCIHFRPTEKDIDHIVEQKNKFRKVPVNFTTEKNKILTKIEEAKLDGNLDLVEKLQDNMLRLDTQLDNMHQQRTKNLQKIQLINERNRRANAAQLEKVLESEFQSWDNNHNNDVDNPFVRRRTNPINMLDKKLHSHFANKLKNDRNTSTSSTKNDQTTKNTSVIQPQTNSTSNIIHPYDISKDLQNLYDFDLDISLDIPKEDDSSKR